MKIFTRCAPLGEYLDSLRSEGLTVGFVPTMGALHRGHLSLVEQCRAECDVAVVSIFVNPTQFNDKEDLRRYPRTEQSDMALLEPLGVDVVFIPTEADIYPTPDERIFDFGALDKVMEGATRPGHFNGVAQVVSRLFDIVRPAKAFFGLKDFQQIAVIKALVEADGFGVQIVECPIVREDDGLAMSSRNALLDAGVRRAAPRIYSMLRQAAERGRSQSISDLERWVVSQVEADPHLKVIYFNIVDPATLQKVERWEGHGRLQGCIAVQAGSVRLIDNIEF